MKFFYTLPLQWRLKIRLPFSRATTAPFFCWDIHMLMVQTRRAVLVADRASLYSFLFYGMNRMDWGHLPELIQDEIRAAILQEGLSEFKAARYFILSGLLITLAACGSAVLNWTMQTLLQHSALLDGRQLSQPQAAHIINGEAYYAAEQFQTGSPREFFLVGFRSL